MFWVLKRIETVLLSTHTIWFGWEIRKIIFSYALLSGGLHMSHAFFMLYAKTDQTELVLRQIHARIQKVLSEGSNLDNVSNFVLVFFFCCWWGKGESKYQYKQAIIGVSLACRWWPSIECWLGSCGIFQWILSIIFKKPYISFRVRTPCPQPPLDPRMWSEHFRDAQSHCCSHLDKGQHIRLTKNWDPVGVSVFLIEVV